MLTTGAKRGLVILGLVGAGLAYQQAVYRGYLDGPNAMKASVPIAAPEATADVLEATQGVKVRPLPSATPVSSGGLTIRWLEWAWNAQMGINYANGGPATTKGSLMDYNGVHAKIVRQDDSSQMQNEQLAFAEAYCKGGQEPTTGVHFVNIMGDGGANYLAPLNAKMKDVGCLAEVIGGAGYSRNEDTFMGPPEVKDNPQLAKGMLIAGVCRDGDWNGAMRFLNRNKVDNNPNDQVYVPTAANWVCTDSYIDAAQKLIAHYCVDLQVKGKPRGTTQNVCVTGAVTWFPGDEMIASKLGGMVKIWSTAESIFQMPCVIIGNAKWDAAHADLVANMLLALSQGADQIRASPQALQRAGEISAQIYKERDGKYWVDYYKGVTQKDKQGLTIALGGSAVSNLADQFQLFGLSGGPNLFKLTYETWGKVVQQQYPELLKSFPPTVEIMNTHYLQMAAAKSQDVDKGAAEKVTYSTGPITDVAGRRDYSINFATGSDQILQDSLGDVESMFADLATDNLSMVIGGHTDNVGNPDSNMELSRRRAEAVRAYLIQRGIKGQRITAVPHGQTMPKMPNDTPRGRAANRRVEIEVGR